ncbi:MAG: hypothetical protein M0R69_04515 [Candidatus Cloacimonetes bacterium]|nr:hypothetical protein [Candidatus Cloacimonadota bacterium]
MVRFSWLPITSFLKSHCEQNCSGQKIMPFYTASDANTAINGTFREIFSQQALALIIWPVFTPMILENLAENYFNKLQE